MASLWPHEDPRWRTINRWFAASVLVFFAYTVCAWRGVLGLEPGWRPLQSVFLAGALLLQQLAALVQRKSRALWLLLLLASLVALGFSVAAL